MQIVQHARIYALALAESGAEAPFVVTASILAVRGKMIGSMREMRGFQGQAADRDQLHLTDVVLEAVPDGDPSCGLAMRPILDQLAMRPVSQSHRASTSAVLSSCGEFHHWCGAYNG